MEGRGEGEFEKEETNIMNKLERYRIIRHPCNGGNRL